MRRVGRTRPRTQTSHAHCPLWPGLEAHRPQAWHNEERKKIQQKKNMVV